jgi:hypothetical protein
MNSISTANTAVGAGKTVVVLLGTPHAPLAAFGEQLATGARGLENGLYVGDLNLSLGRTIGELLQVYELSQTPVHEPLFAFLRQHVDGAAADPAAFLKERADWSFQQLLQLLIGSVSAPTIVFADTSAGFRIAQVDRWLKALPQALFVHALSSRAAFAEAANLHYAGRLFVPPDFRDYSVLNNSPQFAPDLAWFQVHRTVSRALAEAAGVRYCRAQIDAADAHASVAVLSQLADRPHALYQQPADADALEAAMIGKAA